ncbi:MAG: VOC family protein [Alphaproteobacteria bacterium]|nr:VOC family protein [Alphaproteobacteria bacterium]
MDTIEKSGVGDRTGAETGQGAGLLSPLPSRLHHHAYVVRDQEANRRFIEDLLGIPLVATWCEKAFFDAVQREVAFCHTFFGIGDGGALAFFQFADDEMYARTQAKQPAQTGSFDHIALKVDETAYAALKARLDAAGETYRETDHGYCKSVYTMSPDGLIVEFTCDPPEVAEIDAMRRADAHSELARWLAGDRRVNNQLRHRSG